LGVRPFCVGIPPEIPGNTKIAFLLCALSSFACPKEETRKRHPSQSWPCGLPLLLAEGGTRKNSGFALKQSESPPLRGSAYLPRLFRPRLRGAAGQMGRGKIPIGTQPSTGEAAGDLHCLSAASLQNPGSIEEHRASRLRRDKRHRGPFLWFVSLGKQRNEQSNFMLHSPLICEQTFLPGTASVQ
jgi:hypothetical protein